MTIYMRTLLSDLGFDQSNPTQLLIDNTGAVFMVDAQAPTKRTRHVDIRYFALLEWSASGQLKAEAISTEVNISDAMTKALGRIKFHQFADIYLGRLPPAYVPIKSISSLHTMLGTISTFQCIPIPILAFSALHHPILCAFHLHTTDYPTIQSMGG